MLVRYQTYRKQSFLWENCKHYGNGGRYTFYIFMYHLLVRDIMIQYFPIITKNIRLLRVGTFIHMIILPTLVAYFAKKRNDKKVYIN